MGARPSSGEREGSPEPIHLSKCNRRPVVLNPSKPCLQDGPQSPLVLLAKERGVSRHPALQLLGADELHILNKLQGDGGVLYAFPRSSKVAATYPIDGVGLGMNAVKVGPTVQFGDSLPSGSDHVISAGDGTAATHECVLGSNIIYVVHPRRPSEDLGVRT